MAKMKVPICCDESTGIRKGMDLGPKSLGFLGLAQSTVSGSLGQRAAIIIIQFIRRRQKCFTSLRIQVPALNSVALGRGPNRNYRVAL